MKRQGQTHSAPTGNLPPLFLLLDPNPASLHKFQPYLEAQDEKAKTTFSKQSSVTF